MSANISNPTIPSPAAATGPKRLSIFERYLSLWVALCMVAGVALGRLAPSLISALRRLEFGSGSQINAPIAVLIWLMIVPMMLKIDFTSIARIGRRPKGLFVTLFVNWLVKPFSMAFLGWLFFKHLFLPFIGPELADQYTAGVIILAAAPCTAMVFVWSYLSDGDPGLHAGAGGGERSHHARPLRPHRPLPRQRGVEPRSAVPGAPDVGARVHRHPAHDRRA